MSSSPSRPPSPPPSRPGQPPRSALSEAPPWPTSTRELTVGEHLLVWSFRRWVLGLRANDGGHWSLVWNEFARQFGPRDGRAALSAFARLIHTLLCRARRTLRHHQPCCPCLGADEVRIVALVAACQNGGPARALAEELAAPSATGDLLDAGGRLARIMARRNLALPARAMPPRTLPKDGPAPTIH